MSATSPESSAPTLRSMLLRGGGWSLVLNGAALVLAFGTQILLARTLGVEGFGIYSFYLSLLTVAVVLACCGLDPWLLRKVPAYSERGELSELKARFHAASLRVLIASVCTALIVTFVQMDRIDNLSLLVGLLFFLFWSQNSIRQAVLRGLHRPVAARLPDIVIRPLILIATVLAAMAWLQGGFAALWSDNQTVVLAQWSAWLGQLLGAFVAFIVGGRIIKSAVGNGAENNLPSSSAVHGFPGAGMLLGYSLIIVGINEFDRLILGTFSTATQVGIYGASLRIAAFVSFALDAMAISFAPLLATAFVRADKSVTQRLLNSIHRYLLVLTIPLVILLIVGRDPILSLFGREFSGEPLVLAILLCGQLGLVFFGTAGYALTMGGREREALIISGLILLCALIVLPLLASQGLVPFAAGVALLQWIRGALFWVCARKTMQVNCNLLSWMF